MGGVGVPEVQPECPVRPQDPTDFVEDSGEMVHEPFWSGLQTELAEPASTLPAGRSVPGGIVSGARIPAADLAADVVRLAMAPRLSRFPLVFALHLPAPSDRSEAVVTESPGTGGEVTTQWMESSGRPRSISRTSPSRRAGIRFSGITPAPPQRFGTRQRRVGNCDGEPSRRMPG